MSLAQKQRKNYTNDKQISMNYANLREIGVASNYQWVTTLCLSHNKLQHLNGIDQFTFLQSLSIHHNLITSYKELLKIKQPHNMQLLCVHHNPFTLNPNYITDIFMRFKHLKQIDSIPQIHYKTYFHYINQIGLKLIPTIISCNYNQNFIQQINIELKKYDPNIELLNKYLLNLCKNDTPNYSEEKLNAKGFEIFELILKFISGFGNSDLKECLLNQSLQNEQIDLFAFSNDIQYQQQIMYANFLELKQQQTEIFAFPYFPYNFDYFKAIFEIIKQKNKINLDQNIQQQQKMTVKTEQQVSILNKENDQNQSNQIIKQQKQQHEKVYEQQQQQNLKTLRNIKTSITQFLCKSLQKLQKSQISQGFQIIKSYGCYKKSILVRLVEIQQRRIKKSCLEQLKKILNLNRMIKIIHIQEQSILSDVFNMLKEHHLLINQKQIKQADCFMKNKLYINFFNALEINYKQQNQLRQILVKVLNRNRNKQLKYAYKRWILYYLNSKYYEQPSKRQQTQTSISTKNNVSQPSINNLTNIMKDGEKGTNIYCEYVVIQKNKTKKKKKKSNKSNKTLKAKKNKGKCSICREYVDENGCIIPH